MNLGFEIQTTNLEIRISILETPCVPIFRQNGQLYLFLPKFVQKGIGKIELEIHKTNAAKKKLASSKYHLCQFSDKTHNFDFFGLNLPKSEF